MNLNQQRNSLPVDPLSNIMKLSVNYADICKLIGTHLRVVWSASK
jgi:hypothetical protein